MGSLKVSSLFGDGMVLQQGVPVPVAGVSAAAAEITVSLLGKSCRTRADQNGTWRVLLDSRDTGGPYAIEIEASAGGGSSAEKIRINDVYFGDVWVCSGQSNMEMMMQRVRDNYPEEWDGPINPLIRQFKVPQEWDFSGPRENYSGGQWMTPSAENLHEFSATAWFFANALYEEHRTPLGLINAAWGGTPVEAWMSREALAGGGAGAAFPEKIACGEQYASAALCEQIARDSDAAIRAWNDELAAGDSGLTQEWHKPDQWDKTPAPCAGTVTLPGDFSDANLDNFCGVIWLRREFEADDSFAAGKESKVWLGTIVDSDTVFVNGVEVGNITYRYPPRKYVIPAGLLHAGKNHIVIRVVCNDGQGGVTIDKPFKIFSGSDSIEMAGTWEYRVGLRMTRPCPEAFFFQRQPMGLFNAMIAPMLDYPCKGIIWYQGESNDHPSPGEYAALFTAFINDWRNRIHALHGGVLPFIFVQLPIWGEPTDNNEADSWAIIREGQALALSLPATGMAAGLELGEWNDLHPMNKKGIGQRLALAAEKTIYGKANTAPGPQLRGGSLREGRLYLNFDNCGAGLVAVEQPHVSVIAGGKTFRLPANIHAPDCLMVDVSAIAKPERVLYAWARNPRDRQLFNTDGLPMLPFRFYVR